MRKLLGALAIMTITSPAAFAGSLLDQDFRRLASDEVVNLGDEYAGKVILVVNTASKCGNTPQYEGLEKLYEEYGDKGFVVLGFPSNDFGGQEPGSEAQIKDFCRSTYGVEFPMFEKTGAAAGRAHPFFDRLAADGGGHPRWNFHKYLLDRDGSVVASWRSSVKPLDASLVGEIEARL